MLINVTVFLSIWTIHRWYTSNLQQSQLIVLCKTLLTNNVIVMIHFRLTAFFICVGCEQKEKKTLIFLRTDQRFIFIEWKSPPTSTHTHKRSHFENEEINYFSSKNAQFTSDCATPRTYLNFYIRLAALFA